MRMCTGGVANPIMTLELPRFPIDAMTAALMAAAAATGALLTAALRERAERADRAGRDVLYIFADRIGAQRLAAGGEV